MSDHPRYVFHPLERRGVILGLAAGQLAGLGGGVLLAIVVRAAVGGRPGLALAGLLLAVAVAGALWTRDGTPLGTHAWLRVSWWCRRAGGVRLNDGPLLGAPVGGSLVDSGPAAGPVAARRPGRPARCSTAPPGIELIEDSGLAHEEPLGVVHDRRAGTWAAVTPVAGSSFSLLDPAEQALKLDSWRQVLGMVARPGTPVVRVQWVRRSWTGGRGPGLKPEERFVAPAGPAASAYRQLIESARPEMVHHGTWLALVVRTGSRPQFGPARGVEILRRELRFLEGQLTAAGLTPGRPLDLAGLAATIEQPGRTEDRAARRRRPPPWPLAAADGWESYRADGRWHATYWAAEWPRVEVGPDFLSPLLVGTGDRTVSLIMAPVPADRAQREARSARTADVADDALRARAGFLSSARRERESEGATRREEELADGHQEFRFAGYVTVSADDLEKLAEACAEAEHAAQSARLELRRLYGRQAEAYTWTLPLGRGLR